MRIAIDARCAWVPTGIGRYATNLVRALARTDCANDYFVFASRDALDRFGEATEAPNFRFEHTPCGVGDLVWEWLHFPRMLRNRGIDVLHSLAYTFPTTIECPAIVTIYDLFFERFPDHYVPQEREYLTTWTAVSAGKAAAVVCLSDAVLDACARAYNVENSKLFIVPGGASLELADRQTQEECAGLLQREYGIDGSYILHVGAIVPRKNVERLVAACAIGWRSGELKCPLVLVGPDGWSKGPLLTRLAEVGVADWVRRVGHVPDEHLPAFYRNAKLVACVALDEGFGLPAVEAMHCGIPLVVSDRPCFHETCGVQGGVFVDPLDADDIWRGILRLVQDGNHRDRLSRLGRARAQQFSWLSTARRMLAVYDFVAETRQHRPRAMLEGARVADNIRTTVVAQ